MEKPKQRFHLNQTAAAQLSALAAEKGTDEATYLIGLIGGAFVGGVPCAFSAASAGTHVQNPVPTVTTPTATPAIAISKASLSAAAAQFKRG